MTMWLPPQLFAAGGVAGALLSNVPLALFAGTSGARRVKAIVTINGQPVAGAFWEHLIGLTIHDHEGTKSDTIDLDLEDGPPHLRIPENDDEIRCWLGYEDGAMDYMGMWSVNDVDLDCLPWKMKVKGNAADMAEKLKQHARKHWDEGSTLGDVAGWVGKFAGVPVQVAPALAGIALPHTMMENESPLHLLERLSERYNALHAYKDGKLILAERGSGQTAGGGMLPTLVCGPGQIIKGTCSVSFGKREKHNKVSAEYHDRDQAKRRRVSVDGDSEARASYTTRHGFGSRGEAKAAARSRRKYLKRDGIRTSVRIEGNPFVKAGQPMTYLGVRPGVDGIMFIIEHVQHTLTRQGGYATQIQAKVKDEQGGSGGGKSGAAGGGADPDTSDEPYDDDGGSAAP